MHGGFLRRVALVQPSDSSKFSVRVRNSKRAGIPESELSATRAITWVEIETREGYYRDRLGEWQSDRRNNPDRRATRAATASQVAMRSRSRRNSDRDMLQYLST